MSVLHRTSGLPCGDASFGFTVRHIGHPDKVPAPSHRGWAYDGSQAILHRAVKDLRERSVMIDRERFTLSRLLDRNPDRSVVKEPGG
ncbi:MAG TPA: hypothetical protein VED37_09135, partial [Ktedonobacteraceae bacterium]|nr:hypothetical protein [Ktedonobacteraceae bacterium]